MSKLKTVNEIRIDGKWMREEEISPVLFRKILNERSDFAMGNQGFIRKDTA